MFSLFFGLLNEPSLIKIGVWKKLWPNMWKNPSKNLYFHIFGHNFLQTQPILMCYISLCSPKNRLKHSTKIIKINFVVTKLMSINQLTVGLSGSPTVHFLMTIYLHSQQNSKHTSSTTYILHICISISNYQLSLLPLSLSTCLLVYIEYI
jgi:hypothetical protein